MLLRFGFENHRSFRDYTELSFASASYKDEPSYRMKAKGLKHGVLPVVAIYGGNASGKSSLLSVLNHIRAEVLGSYMMRGPTEALNFTPFRLGAETGLSRYDIDFVAEGVRYHYGFACDAQRYHEEWLYAWPKGSKQTWFHRSIAEEGPWYFGPNLEGPKRQIADFTRDNSLFLSAAMQHNQQQLFPVYKALVGGIEESTLRDRTNPSLLSRLPLDSAIAKADNKERIAEFLKLADVGIGEMRFSLQDGILNSTAQLMQHLRQKEDLHSDFLDISSNYIEQHGKVLKLELGHRGMGEEFIFLDPDHESLGTIALLSQLNVILPTLEEGKTLVADEITSSLHPKLCTELIGLFTDPTTNPNGAQLIFSSHNTELIDSLRRDQVYFVDKGRDGASSLTPLSDYRLRENDDIKRGYREGRFGGVPILGNIKRPISQLVND